MLRDVIMQELPKLLRFVKPSGTNNMGGPCPFHKGGEEKTPSFYVNVNNGLYFCHSCGVRGTFVQLLKNLGARADKIELLTQLAAEEQDAEKPKKALDHRATHTISEAILGALDFCPEELLQVGFDMTLLHDLDVGFDKELSRITFPIRDVYGTLVGISGRTVIDAWPRYLVYRPQDLAKFAPADEPAKYAGHQLKNHDHVWNLHNVYPSLFYGDLDAVIVVEGYKACIWMIQQGFTNTVALMGSRMTWKQEALLTKFSGSVFLCLDNNEAGWNGTFETGRALARHGQDVWVFRYPFDSTEGAQPDNLDANEIKEGLDTSSPFATWRRKNALLIGRPQVTIDTDRSVRLSKQERGS
jgi:DNA primase